MSIGDGLIALWRFNGDAIDATGNGHDGIVVGATFDSVNQLLGSACASFDHFNDSIDVGDFGGKPDPFTLNIWIRPNFWGNSAPFTSANPAAMDLSIWGFLLRSAGANVETWISDGTNSNFPGVIQANDWNATFFPPTTWTMITMRVSGTTIDYYKNSVYVNQVIVSNAQAGTAFKAFFGKLGESNLFHYGGLIDETPLYGRAITDGGISIGQVAGGEIAQLWNGGAGIQIPIGAVGGRRRRILLSR